MLATENPYKPLWRALEVFQRSHVPVFSKTMLARHWRLGSSFINGNGGGANAVCVRTPATRYFVTDFFL